MQAPRLVLDSGSRASRVPGMTNEKPFTSEAAIGGLAEAIAQFKG
jgi:hypothetical protein